MVLGLSGKKGGSPLILSGGSLLILVFTFVLTFICIFALVSILISLILSFAISM